MTEPPRRTTYSIFFDLFVLGQRVRGLLASAMADAPLRPEEYATYSVVFEDEQVSPTRMAAQLSMPLTTVVDAIRAMERRGHARRIANPRDGRSYLVVLTGEGLRAHAEANRRFEVAYRAFADALPDGESATRRQVAGLLAAAEQATVATTVAGDLSGP
jgi:DNA-binding MarR family transcriptional regulator